MSTPRQWRRRFDTRPPSVSASYRAPTADSPSPRTLGWWCALLGKAPFGAMQPRDALRTADSVLALHASSGSSIRPLFAPLCGQLLSPSPSWRPFLTSAARPPPPLWPGPRLSRQLSDCGLAHPVEQGACRLVCGARTQLLEDFCLIKIGSTDPECRRLDGPPPTLSRQSTSAVEFATCRLPASSP